MSIYTKTGDNGTTSLIGGKRTEKFSLQIEVVGLLDELNSSIGLSVSFLGDVKFADMKVSLMEIQNTLFNIGGEVAASHDKVLVSEYKYALTDKSVKLLEKQIDDYSEKLKPLNQFILPGGSISSSHLHVARSKARTAERSLVRLAEKISINKSILKYINRLSDLLFTYARYANKLEKTEDLTWQK